MGQLGSWVIRSRLESPVSTSDPSVPRSPCLKALGDILWKKDVVCPLHLCTEGWFPACLPLGCISEALLQVTKSV